MSDPARATLWIRSYGPVDDVSDRQTRALDRLRSLAAAGRFDDVTVRQWGKRVAADRRSEPPFEQPVAETVAAFGAWAERTDRSLAPFFDHREGGAMTESTRDIVGLPTVALAEYEGEAMVHVAPHSVGYRTVAVEDRLDALEAADAGPVPNEPVPTAEAER